LGITLQKLEAKQNWGTSVPLFILSKPQELVYIFVSMNNPLFRKYVGLKNKLNSIAEKRNNHYWQNACGNRWVKLDFSGDDLKGLEMLNRIYGVKLPKTSGNTL
jgi:hypothetical protein